MPIINDYQHVKEIYQQAGELGAALPVFCAEDRETLEAILAAALEVGEEIGVPDLPIVTSWTSRYPGRGQMKLLTASGQPYMGTQLMMSDLRVFTGESSPYCHLRVLPHLDRSTANSVLGGVSAGRITKTGAAKLIKNSSITSIQLPCHSWRFVR